MKPIYRRQLYTGTVGDMKTLERHFALMAEKGWMIDKIGLLTHRYRAIDPCEKRFFVDLLPQITLFDYPENEDAQDYRRICEESGWAFVTASKQFHVFCADSDAPPPTPIHTDNEIQAKMYLKVCRKHELPPMILVLLSVLLLCGPLLFFTGIEVFLSRMTTFVLIGYTFFLAGYVWMIGFSITWYRRVKKAARLNLPLPAVKYRLARVRQRLFSVCMLMALASFITGVVSEVSNGFPAGFLLLLVIPFAAFGIGLWVQRRIDKKQRGRTANKLIFIIAIVAAEAIFIGSIIAVTMLTAQTHTRPDPELWPLDGHPALTLADIGVTARPTYAGGGVRGGSIFVPVYYAYDEDYQERIEEEWETAHVQTIVYRSVSKALARALYDHYAGRLYTNTTIHMAPRRLVTVEPNRDAFEIDAHFFDADEGTARFTQEGEVYELALRKGKTLLRLWFSPISWDAAREAVLNLWAELG